jgi:hypothetical protein
LIVEAGFIGRRSRCADGARDLAQTRTSALRERVDLTAKLALMGRVDLAG